MNTNIYENNGFYVKGMWKQIIKMFLISIFLKGFDYDIEFGIESCFIRINFDKNKEIVISNENAECCKKKPYCVMLSLKDNGYSDMVIDIFWVKYWWQTLKIVRYFKNLVNDWKIKGENDSESIKNYVRRINFDRRKKNELHDLLLNANFAAIKSVSLRRLRELGIDKNNYVYRKGSFYDKRTKKILVNMGE